MTDKPKFLAGSPWAKSDEEQVVPARKPPSSVVPVPSPEKVRNYLGVEAVVTPDPSAGKLQPLRRFFQPLPKGKLIDFGSVSFIWPDHLDGMTRQNIAMFLMVPEFIYTSYHPDKNPKQTFVTPAAAYSDHNKQPLPSLHKCPVSPGEQAGDWSITSVGTEIAQPSGSLVIHIEAVPSEKHRRKIPAPAKLIDDLQEAKELLKRFAVKWNEEHGGLDPDELSARRAKQYRIIKKIEKEIEKYEHVQLVDKLGTGCDAYDVVIPPCTEGSQLAGSLTKREIEQYIRHAFSHAPGWRPTYAAFENKVINLAFDRLICRWWPGRNDWVAAGRPELHQEPEEVTDSAIMHKDSARSRAQRGYGRVKPGGKGPD